MKERGMIKILVIATLAICAVVLVIGALVKSIGSSGRGALSSFSNSTATSSKVRVEANPLLDFGGERSKQDDRVPSETWDPARSPYASSVSLYKGTASSAIQPTDEYVEIRNAGDTVNISGWTLENGKGSRPVQNIQNSYFYPSADRAVIGQGAEFLDPSGNFINGAITLKKGEKAIVTTGGPFIPYKFSINTSFRENVCTGYLKVYPFKPALKRECPLASKDPDVRLVTDECYDYLRSLQRCEDPERDDEQNFDLETSVCRSFMRERFTYDSCVSRHRYDSDFYLGIWRVFLGRKTELWAKNRETITLYDSSGLVVDKVSY